MKRSIVLLSFFLSFRFISFCQPVDPKLQQCLVQLPRPASVEDFHSIVHLSSENQDTTLICWSFSTASFIESEMKRLGMDPVRLSVMYPMYCVYLEKARWFVKTKGESRFSPGDLFAGVLDIVKQYGAVPAEAYEGVKQAGTVYSHGDLYRDLDQRMKAVKERKEWDEAAVVSQVKAILDMHLGTPPARFSYRNRDYTPETFYREVIRLPWDDYVLVTSFCYAPFGQFIELAVPDNWKRNSNFFNIPLDLFYASLREAVAHGYSAAIDADISEPSYEQTKTHAFIPVTDIPADSLTQSTRERLFHNGATTDDHLMHVVSYRQFGGEDWFLVKDSWRTAWEGPNRGYMFFHSSYVKMKVLAYLVHRDAVADVQRMIQEASK